MACKKSELISAINTYTNARLTQDQNLMQFGSQLLSQYLETLEFEAEPELETNTSIAGNNTVSGECPDGMCDTSGSPE